MAGHHVNSLFVSWHEDHLDKLRLKYCLFQVCGMPDLERKELAVALGLTTDLDDMEVCGFFSSIF